MFQDTVILKHQLADPKDPYGEKSTVKTTVISGCRFNLRTVYSGSNNDRQVVANATVIFMPPYTTPEYQFTEQNQGDKLVFDGREYTITSINRDIEPFTNKIYQYKIEVI